jgi:hypothetical protein
MPNAYERYTKDFLVRADKRSKSQNELTVRLFGSLLKRAGDRHCAVSVCYRRVRSSRVNLREVTDFRTSPYLE